MKFPDRVTLREGAEGPGGRGIPACSRKRMETSPKCLTRRGREDLPPRSLYPAESGSVTQPRSHAGLPGHRDTRQGFFLGGGQPCPLLSAPDVSCRSAPAPLTRQAVPPRLPPRHRHGASWNGNTRPGLSPEKQRRKKSHISLSSPFPWYPRQENCLTPPPHLRKQHEEPKPTLKSQSSGSSTPTPSLGTFPPLSPSPTRMARPLLPK